MVLIGRRREGMRLTAREQEKLMVVVAADLARRRKNRGLKLNYPESIALITYEIVEGARSLFWSETRYDFKRRHDCPQYYG